MLDLPEDEVDRGAVLSLALLFGGTLALDLTCIVAQLVNFTARTWSRPSRRRWKSG